MPIYQINAGSTTAIGGNGNFRNKNLSVEERG